MCLVNKVDFVMSLVYLVTPSQMGGIRGCIQKFPDWVCNEMYAYKNKHSLRCNIKGYGGKTH
jgi:hypothetical protein